MLHRRPAFFTRIAGLIMSCLTLLGVLAGVIAPAAVAGESAWPASSDPCWSRWGTAEWCVSDSTLYFQPTSGESGTFDSMDLVSGSLVWQKTGYTKIRARGTISFTYPQTLDEAFSGNDELTDISGLSHFDVSNVTGMEEMFEGDSSLTSLASLENWDTSKVTGMSRMFSGDSSLTNLTGLENWDTSKVPDMDEMFYEDSHLQNVDALTNWRTHTGNVTNMQNMFSGDSSLTSITGLNGWDTSKVTNMNGLFSGDSSLTSLTPLANWTTDSVTDMSAMFQQDASLTSLTGLENWHTGNVKNMGSMFESNSSLTDLSALHNWDVHNVTDMSTMFDEDSTLTTLSGLENWQTHALTNMEGMFNNNSKLSNITALSSWDTSNVTDMNTMFSDDYDLTDVTALSNWVTSNVTDMSNMFFNTDIRSLTPLTTKHSTGETYWDTSNVTDMDNMFNGNKNLKTLDGLEGWQTGNVTNMSSMFEEDSGLTDLSALKNWTLNTGLNVEDIFDGIYEWQKMGIPSTADHGVLFTGENTGLIDRDVHVIVIDPPGSSRPYPALTLERVNSQMGSGTSYPGRVYIRAYDISFYPEGGTLAETDQTRIIKPGEAVGTLPTPTQSGYRFDGWYTYPAPQGTKISETTVPKSSTAYFAHWTQIFKITLDPEGGIVEGQTTPYVKTVDAYNWCTLPDPTRSGYVFLGWYTEETGGTKADTDYMASGDVTLYAHWARRIESMPSTGGIGIGVALATLILLTLVIVLAASTPNTTVPKHAA